MTRPYHQYCGIAKALDVLGGRWTLLIVRELLPGPRRFTELERGLPGIATNLLAGRLQELETCGVVHQVDRPTDGRTAWAVTDAGRELKPALLALGRFGQRWMAGPTDHHVRGRWYLISLQRRYRGGLPSATIGVEVDGEPYTLRITSDSLTTEDGWPLDPDLTLRGPARAISTTLSPSGETADDVEVWGRRVLLQELREALA